MDLSNIGNKGEKIGSYIDKNGDNINIRKDSIGIFYEKDGFYHRIDGSADIPKTGLSQWWYKGIHIVDCDNQKDFDRLIKLILFM